MGAGCHPRTDPARIGCRADQIRQCLGRCSRNLGTLDRHATRAPDRAYCRSRSDNPGLFDVMPAASVPWEVLRACGPLTECRNPRRIATSSASGRTRDEPPHAESSGRAARDRETRSQAWTARGEGPNARHPHGPQDAHRCLAALPVIGLPDTAQLMGHDLHCGCNVER